jgi:hypothetical protein
MPIRKLTQDQVRYIRENYVKGSHGKNLWTFAKMFDVPIYSIYLVIKGDTYKEDETPLPEYVASIEPVDTRRVFRRGEFIPMEFLIENEAGKLVLDGDKAKFE